MIRVRGLRRFLTIVLVALLLLAGVLGWIGYRDLYRPVHLSKPETIIVLPRATFSYVARRLQQRGFIPSALVFKLYAGATGHAGKLKVGEYEIKDGQRPVDILEMLVAGRVKMYRMTIPEGKWASEIEKIIAVQGPSPADFNALVDNPEQWRNAVPFPLKGDTLEGYLFPDTYYFPRGTTVKQIVATMLATFQAKCWTAYEQHPPADGRSFYDVLILASLIESEAKKTEERPIIAGVYLNRLRKGMLLQCDATVLYARKERLKRVLNRDLEIDSPYNTYRYPGLPVGPICNPGLASFDAALHPAKVPYLYYVARGDGSHIFTRTLAEHQAAIMQIRGK